MSISFAALLLTVSRQWRRLWQQLQRWWELAEQRRRLALLDEFALHDLGLSRADALRESERPFWDDPFWDDPLRDDPLSATEPFAAAHSENCPATLGRLPS